MFRIRNVRRHLITGLLLSGWLFLPGDTPGQQQAQSNRIAFPFAQKLTYRIEWRLITAGSATMAITSPGSNQWQTKLDIQSAGLMNRLYRVMDTYYVATDGKFCGVNATLKAEEGKRKAETRLVFDQARHELRFDEHDEVNNVNKHQELDIPPCTHEITGALTSLRTLIIEPGKSVNLPISDGKKLANARVESQAREKIVIDGKTYQTVRYEAFLFDNVLYRRKGRLLLWMTDDSERLPVQMRLQMGFPIGNVSIILEKESRL